MNNKKIQIIILNQKNVKLAINKIIIKNIKNFKLKNKRLNNKLIF